MERTPLNDWLTLVAAAALAAFTGLIGGAIFAGEAGCLREWVSALSGWVAGIGAIGVGVFTIRPLVQQVRIQEHAARTIVVVNAYETINRIKESQAKLALHYTFITLPGRFIPVDSLEVGEKARIIYDRAFSMRGGVKDMRDIVSAIIVVDGSIFAHNERISATNSMHMLEQKIMELEFVADMYMIGSQKFDEKDRQILEVSFESIRKGYVEVRSCTRAYVDTLETLL
jgi:hypothetical protein